MQRGIREIAPREIDYRTRGEQIGRANPITLSCVDIDEPTNVVTIIIATQHLSAANEQPVKRFTRHELRFRDGSRHDVLSNPRLPGRTVDVEDSRTVTGEETACTTGQRTLRASGPRGNAFAEQAVDLAEAYG